MSRKQALTLACLAISGFAGWLYLSTLAGILYLIHLKGFIVVKADVMMLAESILLLGASCILFFLFAHSLHALASQLRYKRKEESIR